MVTWTQAQEDPVAVAVARHLVVELGVPPIALVEDLERVYTPGELDGTALRLDKSGYVVLVGNPAIHFPVRLLGTTRSLSLPVVLFAALYGPASHLCYVWSRLMHLRTVDSAILGPVHHALFVVGEWYADLVSNPPQLDAALTVERPDLRRLVSRFAFVLRMASGTLSRATEQVRELMMPWHLHRLAPFWRDLERAIVGAVVYVRPVELATSKPPMVRCKPGVSATPDFYFDNNVALVCSPMDKLVLVAVLLFSREIGLLKRATLDGPGFFERHAVPYPLRSTLALLAEAVTNPLHHHADHHRTLRSDREPAPGTTEDAGRARLQSE